MACGLLWNTRVSNMLPIFWNMWNADHHKTPSSCNSLWSPLSIPTRLRTALGEVEWADGQSKRGFLLRAPNRNGGMEKDTVRNSMQNLIIRERTLETLYVDVHPLSNSLSVTPLCKSSRIEILGQKVWCRSWVIVRATDQNCASLFEDKWACCLMQPSVLVPSEGDLYTL